MIPFDFDHIINRRNTGSAKWDKFKGRDVIPLWVADMDFASPPAVLEALHRRVEHGVFGYTNASDELVEAVRQMLRCEYDWAVERDWLVWLPGLVVGINLACRAVGEPGDAVLTAVPVYPPFLSAPRFSSRERVTVPLAQDGDRWVWDFDGLESAITPRTRLLLLCSPHNPVGRAWRRDELARVAEIAERHDLVICSDEIHCQLILEEGVRHVPTATLAPEIQRRTITLMAPSKTYNLPGLGCSFAVIPDEPLRRRFRTCMRGVVPDVNLMGYTAALAAYRDSADWHAALIEYLRGNRDLLEREIGAISGLSVSHVEATYLAWIDTRQAGIEEPVKFFEEAGVGLSDGQDFGGSGFVRLNFGCPRSLLAEGLHRIQRAMQMRHA